MAKSKKIRIGKKNKKILIIGGIILLIVVIAVIIVSLVLSNNNEVDKTGDNNKEPDKVEEVKKLQIVDEDSTSRPYAVMINNINVARP